ncbi:MAG: molybdopterin molybdotransferase MoeA [Planctomycetota bacterium]|nr:molybdopterin molybdotransferase MoeA [Planctomycetota bacterium]
MTDSHPTVSRDDALAIVDRFMSEMSVAREKLALRDAVGRTLAENQLSRLELPPFNKSAMDGYAILEGDSRDKYEVHPQTIMAGDARQPALRPGLAVKVMTGAPVPEGAGRVIPVENATVANKCIQITRPSKPTHICQRGEDVRPGDVVVRAGTTLGAVEIANLIGCGITEVDVYRPVRLAVLSTGDEIVDEPGQLSHGKIMNTNGPMLIMLARRFSMDVVMEESIPDDLDATVEIISNAVERSDIVALSGGVSMGDYDFVGSALAKAGMKTHFNKVSIKPGRPLTFATAPGKTIFGLPGNPVSVHVMFHLFVLRAVARMCGGRSPLREVELLLGAAFRRRKAERVEYVPACLADDGTVAAVDYHGSAHLTALTESDGFFVVPAGTSELAAGERVVFLPLLKGRQ